LPPREYILYADESVEKGALFSNFYGGLLISSQVRDAVVAALEAEKLRLNLHGEVKWQKVTLNYLNKYLDLSSLFFELVQDHKIKLRIMFTDNANSPASLTALNFTQRYLLLYLAFVEHAFDFQYRPPDVEPVRLRILLDDLPVPVPARREFRNRVYGLNNGSTFKRGRMRVFPGAVGEIDSRDHVLLQCLDVVLGAMQSDLNAGGSRASGRRSVARNQLSAHILGLVKSIDPGFRIDVTTPAVIGQGWHTLYRHMLYGPGGLDTRQPD